MNHIEEQELILYYYGESARSVDVAAHLNECGPCRAEYAQLQRVLNTVDAAPVPERGPEYGAQVWSRLSLPASRRLRWLVPRWLPAAAMAMALIAAFLAGRYSPRAVQAPQQASAPARDRILLVAVGEHLENSQMVLVELHNSDPAAKRDISNEQRLAADLLNANRLYRVTATGAGDDAVAGVLDDLERVLLEIVHSPSQPTRQQVEHIRQIIDSEEILFKVRVAGSSYRAAATGEQL